MTLKEQIMKLQTYKMRESEDTVYVERDDKKQEICEDWCDIPSSEMTLEQARQAVKDLRKKLVEQLREQTRWIPVSERLPENGKEVLTCSTDGFIEIQSLENLYDVYWENQKGELANFDEVIKWMPLPKSYEPQKSEVEG